MTFFETKAEIIACIIIVVLTLSLAYLLTHPRVFQVEKVVPVTVEKAVFVNQSVPCPSIQCSPCAPCVPTEVVKKAPCVCRGAYASGDGSGWWK